MTTALLVTPYGLQNQGIRLLGAVLRREGFETTLLFFKRWVNNDVQQPTDGEKDLFRRVVAERQPDLIGFGFGSHYLSVVLDLSNLAREGGRCPILWGGVHPTLAPEDCQDTADLVCIGEGEYPLLEIMQALAVGRSYDRLANLWVKTADGWVKNPLRPLIQDLDALPYDDLLSGPALLIDNDRLSNGEPMAETAVYRLYASRGCPFRCSYCYNNQLRGIYQDLGTYHRERSPANVVKEMKAVRSMLPRLRRFRIDDDSFVFSATWIEEFCEAYARKINMPFDLLLNPMVIAAESLRRLRDAGLDAVQMGIQSASNEELRDYQRGQSNDQILEQAKILRRLAIRVTYDLILDNPLAQRSHKDETLNLLLRLPRPFNIFLYSLTLFPKAEITRQLLEKGMASAEDVEGNATKSFKQFRLTFDYPRPAEESFYAGLFSLTSKRFIPRRFVRWLHRMKWLRAHPRPLIFLAETANLVKLAGVAWNMLRNGEITFFVLREYGTLRRRIIQ